MKEVCEETDAKNMKDEAKEKPSDKAPNNTENDSVKDDDDKDVETADDALLELLNENETKESLAKTTEPINSEPDLKQTSGKPESTTGKPESIKDIISNIENSPKKSHESKLSDIEGISRKLIMEIVLKQAHMSAIENQGRPTKWSNEFVSKLCGPH